MQMALDAYEELSTLGYFGPAAAKLLSQIMGQEVQRFAVLRPHSGWTNDAINDLSQQFFVEKGKAVTESLLVTATDIDSIARYLRTCIRNFLVSKARKEPLGRIRRKLEELFAANPGLFLQVPAESPGAGHWFLPSGPTSPYSGDIRVLISAARNVRGIKVLRWEGRRRSPLASDADLISILRAVLMAAAGCVDIQTLTLVLADRFPLAMEAEDPLLDPKDWEAFKGPTEDQPGFDQEISEAALEVYGQLSPSQRALLPHLGKSLADQMEVLGLKKSQTSLAARKLQEALQLLVPDSESRNEITLEIYRLCLVNP